jgi:hypothetical protein
MGKELVAIDDHWKSLGYHSDPHCHTWQYGTHIDSMPKQSPTLRDKEASEQDVASIDNVNLARVQVKPKPAGAPFS